MRTAVMFVVFVLSLIGFSGHTHAELVSQWTFDGDVLDSGPGGNHGTFVRSTEVDPAPVFVADRLGILDSAISLNGTSEYVRITRTTAMPIHVQPAFSLTFWVKSPTPVPTTLQDRRLFSEGSTTSNTPLFNLGTPNNGSGQGLDFFLRNDANATPVNHLKSARAVYDNTWHHVAWIDSNGTVTLYIDGLRDSVNMNYARTTLTTNTTTFGAILRATAGSFLSGALDDIRYFNHALTLAEVQDVIASDTCPTEGDTTCAGLEVVEAPPAGQSGLFTFKASATDGSGDVSLLYMFRITDGSGNLFLERGPASQDTLAVGLGPGTWTVSVTADDDLYCFDTSPADTCSRVIEVNPAPGLVARWPLDGGFADATGNGNDGTYVGGEPVFVPGHDGTEGGALQLDGVDDHVAVLPESNLPIYLHPVFSVALWVKGLPQTDRRMFGEGSSTDANPLFTLGTDAAATPTGKADIFVRNDTGAAAGPGHRLSDRVVLDDAWHHLAVVDEGGKVTIYLDGLRDAGSFSYTRGRLSPNRVALGAVLRAAAGSFFAGAIDEVRVYNHALSAQEVSDLVPEIPGCPAEGDTHVLEVTVTGPPAGGPGKHQVAATAADDSGDPIHYTYLLRDGAGNLLRQVGPTAGLAQVEFDLLPGPHEVTVQADDAIRCKDAAPDAVRAQLFEVSNEPRLLVARWTLDGGLLDEVSGSAGTFIGGVAAAFGEGYECTPNGALALDGTDDFFRAGANAKLPLIKRADFSIAVWVKGMPQVDRRVFSESSSANNNFLYNLGTDNTGATGTVDFFLRDDAGTAVMNHVKSTGTAFDGEWHHLAWVDRRGAAVLYIDGVRDATDFSHVRPELASPDITTIGGILRPMRVPPECCTLNGALDDMRLYNYALIEEEILEIYGEGPTHCCPAEGDTYCFGLAVAGPPENVAGTYTATATALDDSSDPIAYTFRAENGIDPPVVKGPQSAAAASFDLTPGTWTLSVEVDDDPLCPDAAPDNRCSREVVVLACPAAGDTHCLSLNVQGPAESVAGMYRLTAAARDDSGGQVRYTFRAEDGVNPAQVAGPQPVSTASFDLAPGTWTLSVDIDDDPDCPDTAPDARCSREVVVLACPAAGDTHCTGLTLAGPPDGAPGVYLATAIAADETGGPVSYIFRADNGVDPVVVKGPQAAATASFDLTPGEWTVTAEVDDDPGCPDAAPDRLCSKTQTVRVPGVGPFKRSDASGDGLVDITDAIFTLEWLFLGGRTPTCIATMNNNGEAPITITSAIFLLNFLFLGGPEPLPPFRSCGLSTLETDLSLGCNSYAHCP